MAEGATHVGICDNIGKSAFTFDENCAPADSEGWSCAAWVIQKGNQDYLKCPDELTANDSKCPN